MHCPNFHCFASRLSSSLSPRLAQLASKVFLAFVRFIPYPSPFFPLIQLELIITTVTLPTKTEIFANTRAPLALSQLSVSNSNTISLSIFALRIPPHIDRKLCATSPALDEAKLYCRQFLNAVAVAAQENCGCWVELSFDIVSDSRLGNARCCGSVRLRVRQRSVEKDHG
jgi:hypothetical protein